MAEISGTMYGAMLATILILGFAFFYTSSTAPTAEYPSNSTINLTITNQSQTITVKADDMIQTLNSIPNTSSIPLYAELMLIQAFIAFVKLMISIVGLAFFIQFDIVKALLFFLPLGAAPIMAIVATMFAIEMIGIALFILAALRPPGSVKY